jgi:PAS domain S-box-containing protein
MNVRRKSWRLFVCLLLYFFIPLSGQAEDAGKTIQTIIVVSDDNYPPYIFRDFNGDIQGILVDEWKLWENKTGLKVNLIAMDWGKAQESFLKGQADVIDTIFFTEKRAKQYDFTKPYATINVPVFFHKNLVGIVDIESLQGFTIGVKKGDACIEVLKKNGITSLQEYDSYEAIVKAAKDHQIKVFSIDQPPALYYLYKMNLENEFRYSLNLYTGKFHRAVIKGRTDILKIVEDGFSLITKKEHNAIEKKWMGKPLIQRAYLRYVLFFFLLVGLLILILVSFNVTLRRKVRSKTSELQDLVKLLRLSEEKYRLLIENQTDMIVKFDPQNRFQFVSPSYCNIFGKTRKELLGKTFISLIHEDDQDNVKKAIKSVFKPPHTAHVEQRAWTKDRWRWMAWLNTAILDQDNQVEAIVAVGRDIDDQKKIEMALKKSEKRFRDLFNSITDLIYTQDMEGHFTSANPALQRLFGYQADEFIGHRATDFMEPEFEPDFNSRYLEVVKKQGHHEGVACYFKKNKEKIYIEYKSSLVPLAGGEPYISGIGRDVTEKILSEKTLSKLQEQVIQSQKMESIGTLAGGIAHDFNNILFPIMGNTEMLLTDTPEDSPFRTSLKEIYTATLRAKELVKQILTFSRQESSGLTLMKMQPVVKEALKLIRSTIPTTIEIKQDINPDCGVIKADPTQIHQIVMNLATNAYHAMEEKGGEMEISLKEMEFGTLDLTYPDMKPGSYACLIVTDTGVGMDINLTDKIFNPFFTTKAIGKGTGMGLSVVHGIVTAMGGAIQVYSESEKGSEFHVYLPIETSSFKKQNTQAKEPIQGGIEHILLVDDEEAILTMEKRMLTRLGYQVTSHVSSIEALEVFRANTDKFDLIITDMAMPNMPGDKLSAELIKIRPDIPILLCTGFSETISEEKAASLGIKGFILKPIVMKDFFQKIREVLDKD